MKKVLTFLTMMLLFVMAKAQTPFVVFQEGFESSTLSGWTLIDNDGDGFNWRSSIGVLSESNGHNSTGFAFSQSYDNTSGPLTPDNWLVSPAMTLVGTNSSLSFWVCGQDALYAAEHYAVYVSTTTPTIAAFGTTPLFEETIGQTSTRDQSSWVQHTVDLSAYDGQTIYIAFRHFNVTDQYFLDLDDIEVTTSVSSPILAASPSSIVFPMILLNGTSSAIVYVNGFQLTDPISASVTAPFEVSADNTTFSTSATLPATGGQLYVRFAPTVIGDATATLVLSSGTATASVDLSGTCFDCTISALPYSQSFESVGDLSCWAALSANAENGITLYSGDDFATDGTHSLMFSSYDEASNDNYNQYIVTPELPITSEFKMVSFDYMALSYSTESFKVGYSTTTESLSAFTWGDTMTVQPTDGWQTYLDLAIPADAKYIAINYCSDCQYYLLVDNFQVDLAPSCPAPTGVLFSEITGSTVRVNWTASQAEDATDYIVEYVEAGYDNWTSINVTDATSCLISGLGPQTTYNVKVSAICSNSGSTSQPAEGSFSTGCLVGGDVVIGNGDPNNILPFCSYYSYSTTEQVYTQAELGGANTFNSLTLKCTNQGANFTRNINIYLMHTSQGAVDTWMSLTGAQLVYSGNYTFTTGMNLIPFTTPFVYNGTSNLVLIIDDNTGSYTDDYTYFSAHNNNHGNVSYYYSDGVNIDPMNPDASHVNNVTKRTDVIFGGLCDSTSTCATPVVDYVEAVEDNIIVTWVPGYVETAWKLEYKADGDDDWTVEPSVTSPFTIYNLDPNTQYSIRLYADCGGEYSNPAEVGIRTLCVAFDQMPFIENFDQAASNVLPDCWTGLTNYNHDPLYPYVIEGHSSTAGGKSLYVWGSDDLYSYAVLPTFADEILMDTLLISFKANASNNNKVEVGIMSDPNDISTFVTVGSFTTTSETANTWAPVEILTSGYTGNGHNVALRIHDNGFSSLYIDDIHVDYIPSCYHVDSLVADNITATSADISWVSSSDALQWKVVYGLEGTITDPETETPQYVTTTSTTLTGLVGNTLYEVFVKTDCGGEESTWESISFRTACVAVTSLPYMENFDAYSTDEKPLCWSFPVEYNGAPSTYGTNHSAPNSLVFKSQSNNNPSYAVTPQFNIDLSTTRVKFWLKAESMTYSGTFDVGVMSDPTDISTFEKVATIQPSTDWEQYVFDLDSISLTGTGNYIAFRHQTVSSSWYYFLDDVEVSLIPACGAPTDLTVSNVATTSADIDWEDAVSENSWQILVVPSSSEPDFTLAETVSTNSYSATGLVGGAAYTVYLRTDCANNQGNSDWISTSFVTHQEAAHTPYFCDFSDAAENAQWTLINGSLTNKWHIGQPTNYTDNVLFISSDGVNASYATSSYTNVWAYRDVYFDHNALEYSFNFNWKATGESSYDYLHVFIGDLVDVEASSSTSYNPPANLIQLDDVRLNLCSDWQHFEASFDGSQYAGQTKRIYFLWHNDGSAGSNPPAVIDSIQIEEKNCATPYNLRATNLTSTSATILFSANSQMTNWEYAISTSDFNPDTAVITQITDSTIVLNNLEGSTTYYIYVRSICGGNTGSNWSNTFSFTTECDYMTIPYFENFDGIAGTTSTSTNVLPSCWKRINNGTSYSGYPTIYNSSTYASSTPNSLRFYVYTSSSYSNQYAILPVIDVNTTPISSLQMKFDTRKYSTSYATFTFYVGVMTDPYNANTFEAVDTVVVSTTTQTSHTSYFANYTGNGAYIAVMAPMGQYVNVTYNAGSIDNVEVSEAPTCMPVVNVAAASVSTNSIDLTWTELGSATEWNVEYGPMGFTPGTGTTVQATAIPFTVTGLNASTNYDFYVQAICSATDTSMWSTVATIATECDVVTAYPFTEGFENNGNIPVCWSQEFINGSISWAYRAGANPYSSINEAHSGNYNAYLFYSSGSTSFITKLITPVLDLTGISSPYVTFWHAQEEWSGSQDMLKVYYRTSPTDDWVMLQDFTSNITTWTFDSLALPNPTSTYQIAFEGATIYGYGVILDDITVFGDTTTPVITCNVPTNVAASNIAQTSATITWTAGGDETAWNLQYKSAADANWSNSIAVSNTPSYALAGLTANTAYQVRVQAVCDAASTSDWTDAVSFTTAEEVETCPAPTNVAANDITKNSAVITWSQEPNTASSWTVQYKQSVASTWETATANAMTYSLDGLNPDTQYDVQILAICDNGLTSDASETIQFTTLAVGVNDYTLDAAISVYPNPTSGQFTISNEQFTINSVDVYDVYGKLISMTKVEDTHVTLDINTYADGIYFARILTDKGVVTKRIVKK